LRVAGVMQIAQSFSSRQKQFIACDGRDLQREARVARPVIEGD
jgi:hypothetical protein